MYDIVKRQIRKTFLLKFTRILKIQFWHQQNVRIIPDCIPCLVVNPCNSYASLENALITEITDIREQRSDISTAVVNACTSTSLNHDRQGQPIVNKNNHGCTVNYVDPTEITRANQKHILTR